MLMTVVTAGARWNIMVNTRATMGGYWVLYDPVVPGSSLPYSWERSYRRASSLRNARLTIQAPAVYAVREDPITLIPVVYLVTD